MLSCPLLTEQGRLFTTFEPHAEFAGAQSRPLSFDLTESTTPAADQERQQAALFRRLNDILCARARGLRTFGSPARRRIYHALRFVRTQRCSLSDLATPPSTPSKQDHRILFVSTSIQVPTPSTASLASSWMDPRQRQRRAR
ncbi:hypothetical protein MSAN_01855700 [Mycena sanguinolenta]|uniref:Uncharacterized protein n=1 Tax=Mycena sanguinolenta TaxID=230812 RepID=A0A8H7CQC5_9AGAR|nr:hypothetical protein MSAN_01855700 [Mycena sanguinolenta]